MKHSITPLTLTLALASTVACGGLEVAAEDTAADALIPCVYGPDATMTVVGTGAHVVSNGIAHTNDCQTAYVVDLSVGNNYPFGFIINGDFDQATTTLDATNCASASNQLVIFKRRVNALLGTSTEWTTVSSQYAAAGVWVDPIDYPAYCELTDVVVIPATNVPFGAVDQYRVLARPKLAGAHRQARVTWD